MTRHFTRWSVGATAFAMAGWLLAAPVGAQERGGGRGGGGSGGGTAVSRGDSGGASSGGSNAGASSSGGGGSAPVATSGGASSAGGGSRPSGRDFAVSRGGAQAEGARATHGDGAGRGDRSSGGAVAREPMRSGGGDATSTPRTGDYSAPRDNGKGRQNTGAGEVPQYSRPRPPDRAPIGTAVPRGNNPPPSGGEGGSVVTGNPWYYPWGYGGLGYYGWYDPYYDPYAGGGYGGYYPTAGSYDEGSLRLKVKPREAEVFVDGYYVGLVDDFDGVFQRLHVDAGPHHLEIRAPGFETLEFDVHVEPDRTLTYTGELKKLP